MAEALKSDGQHAHRIKLSSVAMRTRTYESDIPRVSLLNFSSTECRYSQARLLLLTECGATAKSRPDPL